MKYWAACLTAPRRLTAWQRRDPGWFAAAHTIKADRQDFDAIATPGSGDLSGMAVSAIMIETMRTAFARYAHTHEPRRFSGADRPGTCYIPTSYTTQLIAANPMPMVGRLKLAKMLPKALQPDSVAAPLAALSADPQPRRRSDWMQRDRAMVLTALLAGLRADELVRANIGDHRSTDSDAVIHVRGKGEGPAGSTADVEPAESNPVAPRSRPILDRPGEPVNQLR